MVDLVPEPVLRIIRGRYIVGTARAVAEFRSNQADEDSLTGALGQAVSLNPIQFTVGENTYRLRIYYTKLRGRGSGAPEKRFGADGIFQIEVRESDGRVLRQKGLPFQAKKKWSRASKLLLKQAQGMTSGLGSGLVIDFRADGYSACSAGAVIEARGSKERVQSSGNLRPLGQILAHDFIDCTMGVQGLYYDPDTELFAIPRRPGGHSHAITTEIIRGLA